MRTSVVAAEGPGLPWLAAGEGTGAVGLATAFVAAGPGSGVAGHRLGPQRRGGRRGGGCAGAGRGGAAEQVADAERAEGKGGGQTDHGHPAAADEYLVLFDDHGVDPSRRTSWSCSVACFRHARRAEPWCG